MKFTIKNYRCFDQSNPLIFDLVKGFTAFVGPNNSGKSSILKFFYEFRSTWVNLSDQGFILSGFYSDQNKIKFNDVEVKDPLEVFNKNNENDLQVEIDFPEDFSISKLILDIERKSLNLKTTWLDKDGKISPPKESTAWEGNSGTLLTPNRKYYFKLILDFFRDLSQCIYIGSFRNILNSGNENKYKDINIGIQFVEDWYKCKIGDRGVDKADMITALSKKIRQIFKFESLEINKADKTLQLIINHKHYLLTEVGSGIAQFIIVLFSAAIKQPSYVLIDEPELNLHPSLQLKLLNALGSYSTQGVVFATHSIGLARSIAEKKYSVTMKEDGKSIVKDFGDCGSLFELIGELNFSAHRDIGYEGLLLVEGPTELRIFQQLLSLFALDHKYILIPVFGSNFIAEGREIQLDELRRISTNINAIIDSEKDSERSELYPGRKAFVDICKKLDINVHCTHLRAIENYFSAEAINNFKKSKKYEKLGPYQKLSEAKLGWNKQESWKILNYMKEEDFLDTDIGDFLSKLKTKLQEQSLVLQTTGSN